jgi:serine protease Do
MTTAIVLAGWSALAGRPAVADPAAATAASAAVDSLSMPTGINLRRTVTVEVVNKTKDAVVYISAQKIVTVPAMLNPFWQFDGGPVMKKQATSLGSGFIVHRDGYVVTNNHVIDHARQISIELANGDSLSADVVGADPDADLAVLRIHPKAPLPTLALGDSSDLMIGEPTIAVGNPLGFSHSVSTGIVSALHRNINPTNGPGGANGTGGDGADPDAPQPQLHGEEAALHDLIQTDAAINPGNSGGPLLNAYGSVIGINTAIRSDAQNIGFAIPINRLRDLIPELMNPSQVDKVDIPLHLAERRTTAEPATVFTKLVTTGEHAVELSAIDGYHPTDIVDAYAKLLDVPAGQAVAVTWSDGRTERLATHATPLPNAIVQARQRFGLSIIQMTPMLAESYHTPQEDGLFITGVDRNSPAARAGIQPGDFLVAFARVRLSTLDDLGALINRLPDHGQTHVYVQRGTDGGNLPLRF